MRYLLDTNILVFLMTGQRGEISHEVREIISDYANRLETNTVCVHELVHLSQTGRFTQYKRANVPPPAGVLRWLDDMGVEVAAVGRKHLQLFSELPLFDDHRDPNDRLIIAQAIADRVPLISSDTKFSRYTAHGLNFIYNKR